MQIVARSSQIAGVIALVCTTAACGSSKPPVHSQRAQIKVENDTQKPVEGASILVNGEAVAATQKDGKVDVQVSGIAGDRFRINLGCPEGYRAAMPDSHEIYVTPGLLGAAPELTFRCEATARKAVVAVRAENGKNLPVRLLGREVGRTDESGVATVLVEAQENEPFELVIDTSSNKMLHPQNPALTFRMGPQGSSFVFDQKFTIEKPKRIAVKPYVPRPI